jgi:HSP20 family protein
VNEIAELKSRIIGLIDDALSRVEGDAPAASGEWTPRVDLYDLPERVVLRADVPGMTADDLDVSLEGAHLVIRGTRKPPQDIDDDHLCRRERAFGSFARRYALPEVFDADQIRATCHEGVLEVVVRKREPTATRRISIDRG